MKRKVNTLVLIYNSFNDPLFQNLVFSYIKTLSQKIEGDFHLVTFEQPQYHIDSAKRQAIKQDLLQYQMYWHPLDFHTGKFLLLKKLWDFLQAFWLVFYLRIWSDTRVIFSFANVSASIGIVLKKLLRMKMIVYSYEPHSEFMADLGFWSRKGLKYKILNKLEHMAGKEADFIMTGTKHMVQLLEQQKSKAKLYRAPTAVDSTEFDFKPLGRSQVREKLGLKNKKVFLYLGKFGGLYYTYQIPKMSALIKKEIPEAFFMVVTSNDHEEIRTMYQEYLNDKDFHVTGYLSYDDVKNYISASDIGISGVPPSPSQKYRSPTKVAEYLLCGVPYITTRGVAEDDYYAEAYEVGMVLNSFDEEMTIENFRDIRKLFSVPVATLREQCRNVGKDYRSKEKIDGYLLEIYEQI